MIILGLVLLLALFLALRTAYRNTFDVAIQKVEVDVDFPRGKELNILHLSDMHIENLSITPENLYDKIKHLKIDLIALTGDQLEREKNIQPFMKYIEVLKKVQAPYGIYVVFGNHDYFLRQSSVESFREILESYGCIVMQNENKTLHLGNAVLNIIGIDDFSTRRSNLVQSYKGVGQGVNLVLTHDPNIVLHMKGASFDYLLSGHFHGGQIHWPKPYHLMKMGKLARMNIIKGLHYYNEKPFYISEGLGQTGINMRAGCRPEITLHTLKGKENKSVTCVS
ncbi:metallophosphoesterase [Aneurinibacillus aneurinilyticus]|jgi:predicted MPP superfamily phosphohydrolase|uniref:Metallophosphoesterase n=2 Tax=Aneurinibacillus aneurinilyticus TaxID=1391 RepID=A0A848CWT0_ANEAE|nr:metallophosphoesterase [Aneurinibacillus aneurinilyticus]ERI09287.1 Ser/Thr phosphatase family protein [Aneurinibacillus aneurinilyticus ATCC 12856]MCI1694583.1 metallophosphoesterase [Aneurinibacillus aneurinilyticus]MED0672235.1 metallophosphoesterase [Aneurinibacillus aneurinilyticus]MED0704657.1 metallophosphoesterase [Aneurinibacillus aneurinilyticus]MED0724025.1 metallophosphoesterase [Aneurinibacillus aneurinilyticus]